MSMTDTQDPLQDAQPKTGPILLDLCANGFLRYFDDNELLEVLCGADAPIRCHIDREDIAWELIYPDPHDAVKRLALLDRFDDVSVEEIPELLTSDRFFEEILFHIMATTGVNRASLPRIKALVINTRLLKPGSTLPEFVRRHFPDVAKFTSVYDNNEDPNRVDEFTIITPSHR